MNKKLLRKKLALMLASLKKKRKYYCELEFLEGTGTQYIDTGINKFGFKRNDVIKARIEPTYVSGTGYFFGFMIGSRGFALRTRSNTWIQSGIWQLAGPSGSNVDTIFKKFDIELSTTDGFILDGIKQSEAGSDSGVPILRNVPYFPLYLGAYATATSSTTDVYSITPKACRFYYVKLYQDNVLVRDLIPVLDWDMTPCMYDKVSGQFFYNQGTGTFQYGREIHYVEYLESTGTQYINTGIKLTNNHSVELDYQLTQASQLRAGLFGALNMTGSNQGRFGSILSPSNSYLEHGYDAGNNYWQQGLPDTNRHKLYQKKNETYFDGTLVHTFNSATFSLAVNAYLGNFVYTNYTPAKAKYYSSRWWDSNTLVRDFYPAIDENGVGFMFDRVSHTCYLNQGTGAFKYPAREVEYLQSSGTQYIDTGIQPTDDYGYKIRNTYTLGGGEQCAIGCMDNGNRFVGIYTSGAANQLSGAWGSFVGFLPAYSWTTGDILDIEVNYKNSRKMIVDGTELKDISDVHISGTISNTLYLFARHYGSTITTMKGNVYGIEITNGQNVVADFTPVLQDGQAGMLDKANSVFYPNAGTGTFSVGKIVESRWFK